MVQAMIQRTFRVPAALWQAVTETAQKRGEHISDVIRHALENYVETNR